MQAIAPVTSVNLLAAGQLPLLKLELYFPDNRLGTMTFLSGSIEPRVNEILTGAISAATAKVFSVNRIGGTWAGLDASGTIELRDCFGCFHDNETINGSIGGLNILTANHPDGTVGVDKLVKNGAFVHDIDPPNDWTEENNVDCDTVAGGMVGNCAKALEAGANNPQIRQEVVVEPGKIYKFAFYHKDIDGTSDNPQWKVYDQTNAADIKAWTTETANAAWTLVTYTFEAPAACVAVRIYLRHSASNGDADAYYFDEITLYELDEWINLNSLVAENYVEGDSISLGGASMTPNPIEGTWGATLFNEDGMFHPQHPTSPYIDYLKTERQAMLSLGATYGGTDYYWQRIIGYMDEPDFSIPDYRVAISGGDYMKRLRETELRIPDNYWGLTWTTNSISSDGIIGANMYNEADAMTIVPNEVNAIPVSWVRQNCLFNPVADPRTGSAGSWSGSVTGQGPRPVSIKNLNVGAGVADKSYQVKFWHRIVGGTGLIGIRLFIVQDAGTCIQQLYFPTGTWKEETFYFTAQDNSNIQWWFGFAPVVCDLRLDDFSITRFKFYYERYYDLPAYDANEKGVHHVTLNPVSNGAFITTVNEWTAVAAVLTNVAGGQVGNCMRVASSGAALGKAYQDVTTVVGEIYKLSLYFKKGTSATGKFMIGIVADEDSIYNSPALSDAAWTAYSHTFIATATITRITMQTTDPTATENSLFDEIVLDPIDVWQGEVDEGWYYAEYAEPGPEPPAHPAGIVFLDPNKTVATGVNNLIIYYFTQQEAENVVASLLFKAGVADPATNVPYVDEAAALTAMVGHAEYVDPNVQIDKVWFKPGTTCLDAIKKVCERCGYRFYFDYDGTPVFRPKAVMAVVDFEFTDPKHIASINSYQDRNEIKNRIVIQGMKQAEPVEREETRDSDYYAGEASDATSIALDGERTLTINNHLFQDDVAIAAMCTALLAEYKNPKWYSILKIPFNPVPLVMGDTIKWKERLSPTLNITKKGIIRDIKIDNFNTTYKCELAPPPVLDEFGYARPVFLDDFDDAVRDPAWTDEANNGTITEADVVLTLAIANAVHGDFWGAVEDGPLCTIEVGSENTVITTKLNNFTVNNRTRMGLFITDLDAGTNGIYFGRSRRDEAAPTIRNGLTVIDMNVAELAYVADTTLPMWLRVRAYGSGTGSTMYFDYSTDGETWTNLHVRSDETWNKVGLLVWNYAPDWSAIEAPFEFFRIDSY